MSLHIVLVHPEIPANTGNIARTCACSGMRLHLVHPLGFATDDRTLRRAGLDYWHELPIEYHNSFDELVASRPGARWIFTTTDAHQCHTDVRYRAGDHLVFGRESRGLSDEILGGYAGERIRIPMLPTRRSLNLSNAVAIVAYEALRQLDFPRLV